jgi:hypothetical protein
MTMSRQFWKDVGDHIEGGILDNIATQRQANGRALKRNAPKTLERKLRLGRGARSLVDEKHRFVQGSGGSYKSKIIGSALGKARGVVVSASGFIREIGGYLEARGYVGWFGINKKALAAIKQSLTKEVARLVKKAAKS